jgi:hypothetical protein
LRAALPRRDEPLALRLPLDPVRDLYTLDAATPLAVPGDAARGGPLLVFYAVPDAPLLAVSRLGSTVQLAF